MIKEGGLGGTRRRGRPLLGRARRSGATPVVSGIGRAERPPPARIRTNYATAGCETGAQRATVDHVILDAFVVAVERHRDQMAPLLSALEPSALGPLGVLVEHLERSDRELGRLCQELRAKTGLGDPGRTEPPPGRTR